MVQVEANNTRAFSDDAMAMRVRKRIEENEDSCLSPLAVQSANTRGRERPEPLTPLRTVFQVDRDRITHSKAFRRLKAKTQVFISPNGDHFRTRISHTLEVTQVGRTIARALRLNEDLTEAIGLAHDLGHTPFGHAGEQALKAVLAPHNILFTHTHQSLRIVEMLEKDGVGLNLTFETRDGIINHSKPRGTMASEAWGVAASFEGQVIKYADAIAYVNHDIDDAIRAGLFRLDDLPQAALQILGRRHSERINTLVADVVEHSWAVADPTQADLQNRADLRIGFSPRILEVFNDLREYMFANVYAGVYARREDDKAKYIVGQLFAYYMQQPDELPHEFQQHLDGGRRDPLARVVTDYIAGMTDGFARNLFEDLYLPRRSVNPT